MKIKTFLLRMDDEMHKKLKTKAANEETSMTDIIIDTVKEKIGEEEEGTSNKKD